MDEVPNKLGGYVVERELGRGGMGVVYLARDPRLDRLVAIKSLNEELGEHPERLARFEREARTLAAINDPNIAIVFGMDEELGRQLLVMEYVPGHNLADHIKRSGRLEQAEAYAICVQIASGLESAHELGIVHRDLKPANVRVREDGAVKVLDFGLAKPEQEMRALMGDDAETLSMAPTAEGRIMGTAGYMSPEQARGRPVDKRADIWAFGAVLFECLAGVRAFKGDTPMDAIVALLEKDPPWERLPESVPERVRELIRRCLEKDAKKRLRDIGDARIDLESQLVDRNRPDPRRFLAGMAPGRATSDAGPDATRSGSSGQLGTLGSTIQSRLPNSMTSFIGRSVDLEKLRDLLSEARLVTLTGAGGCGKSRLAIEVGRQSEDLFRDGVWCLDLAAVEDPDLIGSEVVGVFGLPEAGGRLAEDVVAEALADRELLLLLDNCEHLGKEISAVVQRLLRACPGLRVIATTREPLGITGEWVFRVGVLGVPGVNASGEEIDQLRDIESVQLFIERARVVKPGFVIDTDNAGDVAEICRRLDGVPLAIELAAARMKLLRPDQIATRLNDRFKLLRSRTGDPRQQTLLAAIEWSYEQLDDTERAGLQRLSVFRGGATLGAAEAVVSADFGGDAAGKIEPWEALDLLENLVDKSMIVVEDSTGRGVSGETRYRLLESIRQYGHDLLVKAGDGERAMDALLAWAARLATRAEPQLLGSDQTDWFERLEQEHGNLRAALEFCFEHPNAERLGLAQKIGAGAWRCWAACGRIAEARRLLIRLDKSAEGTEPTAAWAQIREGIGSIATTTGDLAHAVAYGRAGLELARHNGDERTIGGLLACLGAACLGDGIPARAHDYYEESLQIRRAMGDRVRTAMSLCGLGECYLQLGEFERAASYLRDAEETLRGAGGGLQAAAIHAAFAGHALSTGDLDSATDRLGRASTLQVSVGAMTGVPALLERYACAAEKSGSPEKAIRLFAAAAAGRERLACPARPSEEDASAPYSARAQEAVGGERRAVLAAEGRKMPLRRALRYAKGEG